MGTLPAISVDSLGNRRGDVPGYPALTRTPGTGPDRQRLIQVVEGWRRDPPGQPTDDPHQMARSFTSGVYIAVNTIMTAMSGATVQVLQRRRGAVKKSGTATSAAGSDESEWSPVDDGHELAELFRDPNPKDTAADFLAEYTLCRSLFGLGAILAVPGRDGKPAELWNLRRNYLTATAGMSAAYPSGAWRYYMPQPMLWSLSSGTVTLPREWVCLHRRAHPLWPWDAYSPLTGGAKLVDMLNSVIDAVKTGMDRGLSLDAVVALSGSSPDQLEQADQRFREKYTGSNRGQRFAVVDGERVDVKLLGSTPDKMAFGQAYADGVKAVLALFGVPAVCAFLADSDYSGFYAAARAWRDGNLGGESNSIGQRLTKDLIRPYWGADYRVEVKLPPLMDPDQRERQITTLLSAKAILVNEARAAYDMKPLPDGDVTPDEYAAKWQQNPQPEQPGGGDDPLAALLGGDPNAEPAAPGGVDNPDVGDAAAGSLPGAVSKGVDLDSLTRAALRFAKSVGRPNPCWPGYEMVGTKVKNGKRVPNCVPIKRKKSMTGCGGCSGDCDDCQEPRFVKAEYRGRTVTLNKPFRTKGGAKKFAVYVRNEAGNVVIVRFGDPDMEIKRDDPEARKNFRARHNCADAKDKTKAAYWSCRMWSKTPVSEAAN